MSNAAVETTAQLTAVVCDDDDITRRIVTAVVERAGYRVIAGVATALEALYAVMDHRPDLLMLDLAMPGMSGEEILESLRGCCPETEVVIHSAHDPRVAVKLGAKHIATKGRSGALERALERIAMQRGLAARTK